MREMKEEMQEVKAQNVALSQQLKAAQRRTTKILAPATPLPSPPKVSSMTHSTYANLNTPSVKAQQSARLSVGASLRRVDEPGPVDEDDMGEEYDEVDADEVKEPYVSLHRAAVAGQGTEASRVAKVLAKAMVKPDKFSGETEKERENVETWVEDVTAWLDSQFSQFEGDHSEAQWTLVQSLLGGTAKNHMRVAKQTDPTQTWETLKQGLIDFIRGGQESRSLWRQKMDRLVYGRGSCGDLLKLEKEFEQLRIKLYPTSSSDEAMNAVVGRLYGQAIERGSPQLAAEMQRILAVYDKEPTLSQWKNAAVKAEQILKLTSQVRAGGREYYPRYGPRQYGPSETRAPEVSVTVNEVDETAGEESDTEDPGAASVQQMQGRGAAPRPPSRAPRLLTDEEYQTVMRKKLCLQCYQPGHRARECKERGKPRRRPTAEQLKD
jgi:hypothetical protein